MNGIWLIAARRTSRYIRSSQSVSDPDFDIIITSPTLWVCIGHYRRLVLHPMVTYCTVLCGVAHVSWCMEGSRFVTSSVTCE